MKYKKRMLVLFVAIGMLMNTLTIYGEGDDKRTEYIDLFTKTLDYIREDYVFSEDVTEEELFLGAMNGMFELLDPYSKFMEPVDEETLSNQINLSYVGIGVRLDRRYGQVFVKEVFKNSPADKAGVQIGDVFKRVNGEDLLGHPIETLLDHVLGEEGSEVEITFLRNKEEISYKMIRSKVVVPSVTTHTLEYYFDDLDKELVDQVGYIALKTFSQTAGNEFEDALNLMLEANKNYIILDLRDNGGGYVTTALDICNMIIPKGDLVKFVDNKGGETVYTSSLEEARVKIVALINENSASASEIMASAIQDSEVGKLVGENTFGKGTAQYIAPLNYGYYLKLTYQEFYSRNNNKIHGIGISPDYEIRIPSYISSDSRLYIHDEKESVQDMEKILSYLGYDVGAVNEVYDIHTFNAVMKFQADMGLHPYGVCDFTTQKTLNQQLLLSVEKKDIQLEKAVEVIREMIGEND